jgi:hypothetical protein
VRKTLSQEIDLRARGVEFVDKSEEGPESQAYRDHLNSSGSPSDAVAMNYRWHPGTELARKSA